MIKKLSGLFSFLLILLIWNPKAFSEDEGIVRKPLLDAHFAEEKSVDHVEVKEINFSPLQKTGLHLHPCPVIGYIVKGTIAFQIEGMPLKTLHSGDVFF